MKQLLFTKIYTTNFIKTIHVVDTLKVTSLLEQWCLPAESERKKEVYCGRQEEPAILIARLLLRMRRMCVASIRLDFP